MTQIQKISLFLLRLTLGWLFLYAGYKQLINPDFSALGYLQNAQFMGGFYSWLASPSLLPIINFINMWGLFLLGLSLIFGVLIPVSAPLGIILVLLYRLPLGLIHPDKTSYIVDSHVIYLAALLILLIFKAGSFWSIADWLSKQRIITKIPGFKQFIA